MGLALATSAGVTLVWPRRTAWLAALAAAGGAGTLALLIRDLGVPLVFAAPLATLPPAAAALLSAARNEFAPQAMRDEALLLVVVGGLGVAMLPGISDGWHSALTLRSADPTPAARALPMWAVLTATSSLLLGGAYGAWRRG